MKRMSVERATKELKESIIPVYFNAVADVVFEYSKNIVDRVDDFALRYMLCKYYSCWRTGTELPNPLIVFTKGITGGKYDEWTDAMVEDLHEVCVSLSKFWRDQPDISLDELKRNIGLVFINDSLKTGMSRSVVDYGNIIPILDSLYGFEEKPPHTGIEKWRKESGSPDESQKALKYFPDPKNFAAYRDMINEENFKVSDDVLHDLLKELAVWIESVNKNSEDKENLPNLCFLGEPGTGKTSLADKVAQNIVDAEIIKITPADLKGLFIGHTKGKVVEKFKELKQKRDVNKKTAGILFIDEAYTLFQSSERDSFAREAIEILLKAMESHERFLEGEIEENKNKVKISVTLDRNIAVWMGGYEKKLRAGLSENSGMYSRVRIISFPIPKNEELWQCFCDAIELSDLSDNVREELKGHRSLIEDYFQWGRSKTYAEFFANYRGVHRLVDDIRKTAKIIDAEAFIGNLEKNVEKVIDDQKREIRKQYQIVVEAETEEAGRLPFLVYTDIKETFADYIGGAAAVAKMRDVITLMVNPGSYPDCSMPKGSLLVGPPGTGKTYLARCMAGEIDKQFKDSGLKKDTAFIKVQSTELKTPELISVLFSAAEDYDNVIIFIDEIDAIGIDRNMQKDPSPLMQLLNEMDGFESKNNVFVLAATNNPGVLDPALVRPGRFDTEIEVSYPDISARRELVDTYVKDKLSDSTKQYMVQRFAGSSPVDIKNVINKSRILYFKCNQYLSGPEKKKEQLWLAHRKKRNDNDVCDGITVVNIGGNEYLTSSHEDFNEKIFLKDFDESLEEARIGERTRPDKEEKEFSIKQNKGLSSTAVHEVGHAMACVIYGMDFEKITILQRGSILGFVKHKTDNYPRTKKEYLENISVSLAGRAAEEIVYKSDEISSGASGDIMHATSLARDMIMRLGMGSSVGMMALEKVKGRYLGGTIEPIVSDSMLVKGEDEAGQIINETYRLTVDRLKANEKILLKLAEYLFEKEELSGIEFTNKYNELKRSSVNDE